MLDGHVIRVPVLLGALLLADPGVAGTAAESWLMKMNSAARELSYSGVFAYLHDNQLEALRIVRLVREGRTQERLYSLNGEAREVIRDADQVWCYLPGKKMGVHQIRRINDSGFPKLPRQVSRLREYYEMMLGERTRVADRSVQALMLHPRDQYRYGYALWADIETGLLLKAHLLDGENNAVEQYQFLQIRFGDSIPAEDLQARTARTDLEWHGEKPVGRAAGLDGWRATRLPPGFQLASDVVRYVPTRHAPAAHPVYSDGLAMVSVFVEARAPGKKPMTGLSRMGAVHAFGTLADDYQVTVVGEVPAATVDLMGRFVRRTGGADAAVQ